MIDYSLIDEEKMRARLEVLPSNVRNVLESEEIQKTIQRIGREHFLDAERVTVLKQLTALGLLGFVSLGELSQEISDNLPLNQTHSKELAEELMAAVFDPVKKDLERIYEPATQSKAEEETSAAIPLTAFGEEKPRPIVRVGVEAEKPAEGKPLIIHQKETPTEEREKPFKGLEFPFGFFGKEGEPAPSEPVKVRVEGPTSRLSQPLIKKEEKRVVHYSELRTPLAPFQKPEEIINLETFGRKPQEVKAPAEVVPPKNAAPETKPQPKIEGNVVDLRE